ncbi:hypothetical protein CDAR_435241 [Caerostris darwini]|uniref:Uncharacterized protein n=1 Tax=Caerostris darwini TaxID=1538125 RepID=A0AAV4SKD7_9ARAC|nr:hypothetical protein CDAR_435241 [Caerostris darwini]
MTRCLGDGEDSLLRRILFWRISYGGIMPYDEIVEKACCFQCNESDSTWISPKILNFAVEMAVLNCPVQQIAGF